MNRQGRITIDGSCVRIEPGPDGGVWLSCWELAGLFGIYTATVTAGIKAIIRSGAVKPPLDGAVVQKGNTLMPETFGMDVIIALAFRLDSPAADAFRKWIICKVLAKPAASVRPQIVIRCVPVKGVD